MASPNGGKARFPSNMGHKNQRSPDKALKHARRLTDSIMGTYWQLSGVKKGQNREFNIANQVLTLTLGKMKFSLNRPLLAFSRWVA